MATAVTVAGGCDNGGGGDGGADGGGDGQDARNGRCSAPTRTSGGPSASLSARDVYLS